MQYLVIYHAFHIHAYTANWTMKMKMIPPKYISSHYQKHHVILLEKQFFIQSNLLYLNKLVLEIFQAFSNTAALNPDPLEDGS